MVLSPDALIAQLEAQRRGWVSLDSDQEGGPAVLLDTPSQFAAAEMVNALRSSAGDRVTQLLCEQVRDWRGITQADLLGAGVGSAEAAPYAPRLLAMWLADRPDTATSLAVAAIERASAARQRVGSARGN